MEVMGGCTVGVDIEIDDATGGVNLSVAGEVCSPETRALFDALCSHGLELLLLWCLLLLLLLWLLLAEKADDDSAVVVLLQSCSLYISPMSAA